MARIVEVIFDKAMDRLMQISRFLWSQFIGRNRISKEMRNFLKTLTTETDAFKNPAKPLSMARKLSIAKNRNGEITGFAGITKQDTFFILVKRRWQGKGIGKKLARSILQGEDNIIILFVDADNILAVRLYEEIGFKKVAVSYTYNKRKIYRMIYKDAGKVSKRVASLRKFP